MQDQHFSIKPAILILLSTFVLALLAFYFVDHSLTYVVASYSSHHSIIFWRLFSLIFTPSIWKYVFILAFLYVTYRLWQTTALSQKISILYGDVLCAFIALIVTGCLKHIIGRARPFLLIHNSFSGFYPFMDQYNYFSMPSGHVMVATVLVCTLFSLSRNVLLRAIAVICLCLVAMSRIILLKHYCSDCIVSIGVTCTIFAYRAYIFHMYKAIIQWLAAKLDQ